MRFAPGVMGYFRARGVEDPEAVTQEVFIAVLPKIGKIIGGEDGIRTQLFSTAHARAVDQPALLKKSCWIRSTANRRSLPWLHSKRNTGMFCCSASLPTYRWNRWPRHG